MDVRIFALLAGGLLSALLVAGCGGDSGTGATTAPLGKAEFIKRADAACTQRVEEARTKFFAYGRSVAQENESPAERKAHYATVAETIIVPELRQQIADVKALGVPKGDEEGVEAILLAIENGIAKVEAHPKQAIEESERVLEPAGKLAKAYGLEVCGTG